jgi:hypothetical protein
MGNQRTSIKDVMGAIETQTASIDALITALTATAVAAPVLTEAVAPSIEGGNIEVDASYLAHMQVKAAEHATTKGEDVVLYARKNKSGETKLAYALRSRYDDVVAKQPSCLGPVESYPA